MSVLIVKSDWEDVLDVQAVTRELFSDSYFTEATTYYKTKQQRATEEGYMVKDDWVYQVNRCIYQDFKTKLLKNKRLEYDADKKRCRLVEEIDIKSTRKIIDDHTLWGNAIEIVKNLRDGLSPRADSHYKDLCLSGILFHFQILDDYLGLLPADSCPSYKEVLHSLKHEEDSDDDSDGSEN